VIPLIGTAKIGKFLFNPNLSLKIILSGYWAGNKLLL